MDNIGEIVFTVLFALFVVLSAVRRAKEGRDVEQRDQEGDWTGENLPEETRRMLFGDPAAPTARPAAPKRNPDPFVQVRDVIDELRRQIEPQVAKPRQGAPRAPQPPALPPHAPAAPKQPHPLQPQFRPAQPPPQRTAPQRPAPRPQPPRMVPQQSEGAMRREMQAPQQRPAPAARRQQAPRPAVQLRDPDEGPTMPVPRAQQPKQPSRAPRRRRRWLATPVDLRRGIVVAEILGPPRAMREYEI